MLTRMSLLVVVWLWLMLPTLPIAWSWSRCARRGLVQEPRGVLTVAVLALTTLSYLLILVGLFHRATLGPDYSSTRFTMIYSNLVLMGATAVAGLAAKPNLRLPVTMSSCLTGTVWLYLAIISSVV